MVDDAPPDVDGAPRPLTSPVHIPAALFPVYVTEVTRQCDGQDGVKDSIVSDPYGCNFAPEALLCSSGTNSSTCFTPAQLSTLYHIFSDWVETNQTFVFPGLTLGTDPTFLAGGEEPSPLGQQFIENFYLNVTQYDYTQFDFATVQFIENLDTGNATADKYDLSTFNARGGKMIMYHGLADPLIATGSSTYYYRQVLANMGSMQGVHVDDFYRLFLVPGMSHCAGSANNAPWYIGGANQVEYVDGAEYSVPGYVDAQHDVLLAMMRWVEEGVAPDSLVATKFVNDTVSLGVERQRPLCAYPKQARYDGVGDVDLAESWACEGLD